MDDATTVRMRPWQVPRLVEPEPTRPPPIYVRPPPRFTETGKRVYPWEEPCLERFRDLPGVLDS